MSNIQDQSSKLNRGPVTYVALGDSTGVGVGARNGGYVKRLAERIAAVRPGSRLINLCVSGAATPELLRDQVSPAVQASPQLITIGIGINDIGHGITADEFAKNFETILAKLRSQTQAVIVVTNIPDVSSSIRIPSALRSQSQQTITQYNERLAEIARRYGAQVVDVYTLTHEELPRHPEYFSADGFHPSDKGYELWAKQMWPTLAALLEEKSGIGAR
jgi:lysophospholipase L1-like esterase